MSDPLGIKKWLAGVAASVAVVLLVQTGTLIWWASRINTEVSYLSRAYDRIETRLSALEREKP